METLQISEFFDNFVQILNKIKLDKTSAELYELIGTIKICKDIILQTKNISQNKFSELVQIINKQVESFLCDVNNNQEIKKIIEQSYYMKIEEFYKIIQDKNNVYYYKYQKYKQKYIKLKNQ